MTNRTQEDQLLEQEFEDVITLVNQTRKSEVPSKLDRRIKQLARQNPTDEIEQSWILSNGARLTLAILVFFAIAMLWILV